MIRILCICLALFLGVSSAKGASWPPDEEAFCCSSLQASCESEADSTEQSEAHVQESLVMYSLMDADEVDTLERFMEGEDQYWDAEDEDEEDTLEGFMKDEAQYWEAEMIEWHGEESDAYEAFKELANMGETSYWKYAAQYRAGAVAIDLGEPESVVEAHLVSAFELRPTRAESLLLLAQYFAAEENYAKAFLYAEAGRNIPHPEDSAYQEGDKFTGLSKRNHYAFGFLHEICSVSSHRIGNFEVGKGACEEIIAAYECGMFVPDDIVEETKESLHFYESEVDVVKPLPVVPSIDSVDLVDKVYLINLDRRPERLERMDSILNKLGLPYERIPAVDGTLDVTEKYIEQHKIRPLTLYETFRKWNMKKAEIGCFMSHYKIWLDITKSQYNQSLVLEDDVSFSPDFTTMLPSLISEVEQLMGENWDVILLAKTKAWGQHGALYMKDKEVKGSHSLISPSFSYDALAYLVSAKGAAKLVDGEPLSKMVAADDYFHILSGSYSDYFHTVSGPYSVDFSDTFPFNETFNLFSARPSLAWPTGDDFESDIQN